jgi:hypothetical protein
MFLLARAALHCARRVLFDDRASTSDHGKATDTPSKHPRLTSSEQISILKQRTKGGIPRNRHEQL